MVNQKNILIVSLICFACVIAFFWLHESDEDKIKKRFDELAEETAKATDEKELAAVIKAKKISELCADSFQVDFPSYSISRKFMRNDISAQILAARARYSAISVNFYDISIDFPEEGIADVTLTGSVEAALTSGESVREIHELRCRLEKIEKDWLFAAIEGVDVLDK
ncbi:MAG: hypothetical protein MUE70_15165 [Desulfobacterales bacterium]|jgi:hypothetical protein|nr:hypothetical protein [Desulfobacterales bacterium]